MVEKEHHHQKRTRKRNNMTARRYRVLDAHFGGASERQIAVKESISPALAHSDLKAALEMLAQKHMGIADEVRAVQMERYSKLLMTWWQIALSGDLEATDRVLRILSHINQINGVIPDKPMITLQQNNVNINSAPVTFHIESANDDLGDNLPEAQPLP